MINDDLNQQNLNSTEEYKIDFSIFQNTEKFTEVIDLRKATLNECIDVYIKYKGMSTNAHRKYSSVKKHIAEIQKKYNLSLMPIVIGDVFWKQFFLYLKEKGLKNSTIISFSSRISAVLKWAANYGAKLSPTFDDFHIPEITEKPTVSLSQDDVSRITYFDIDALPIRPQYKETLKLVRDQFVISCFLGQRWSDMIRYTPESFQGDKFTITQQKTGQKSVVDMKRIAAYPAVLMNLLEKYEYKPPYTKSLTSYNKHLHELFKLAGFDEEVTHEYKDRGIMKRVTYKKYQLISSHTARRTMITNAINRGMHTEQVRRASGHKSERAFARYVVWND